MAVGLTYLYRMAQSWAYAIWVTFHTPKDDSKDENDRPGDGA